MSENTCVVCSSHDNLIWHQESETQEKIRTCASCHGKLLSLYNVGIHGVEAIEVSRAMAVKLPGTTMTSKTKQIGARVPFSLLGLKRQKETDSEFVIRAIEALKGAGNPLEHQLMVKMVKVFVKNGIKMELTDEEFGLAKELYKE